jgi:hypothetical protein
MSTCTTCPTGSSTASTASTKQESCLCVAGYVGGKGGPCTLCSPGTYSLGGVSTQCAACPAGKYGASSGLGVATCTGSCSAGYYCPLGTCSSRSLIVIERFTNQPPPSLPST